MDSSIDKLGPVGLGTLLSHHRSLVDCALQSNAQVPMPPFETAWTKLVEYIRTGQPEHRAPCIGALARLVPFATRAHKQEAWFQAHDWPDLVACALGSEWDSQVEDNIGVRLACLGAMKCLLEDPTVPVPPTWEHKIYVAGFDQDEHVRLAAVALWKPLVLRKEEPCLSHVGGCFRCRVQRAHRGGGDRLVRQPIGRQPLPELAHAM